MSNIPAFLSAVSPHQARIFLPSANPSQCARRSELPVGRPRHTASRRTWVACAQAASKDGAQGADDQSDIPAGPAPAPTAAGISTVGLPELDANLLEACYVADIEKIEEALEAGGSVTARDVNQRTALHFCAGNGLDKIVKDLIQKGAEINTQDILGLTPLHMATGYKRKHTVGVLVEAGADANIACYGGELAVELGERLLAATPDKKFFRTNPEWETLKEIVKTLDDATEVEEDAEDETEEGEDASGDIPVEEVTAGGTSSPLTPGLKEETVGPDGTKVVVRVREKTKQASDAEPPSAASTEGAEVKVTVRTKSRPTGQVDDAPAAVSDATVVVRGPGE